MACGSSCCGPGGVPEPVQPPADGTCFGPNPEEQRTQRLEEPAKDVCFNACCDSSDKKPLSGAVDDGRYSSGPVEGGCQQDCCGSDTKARDEATIDGCQQGCCSKPKGSPSCDKDKTSISGDLTSHGVSGGSCSKVKAAEPCQQTEASCCEAEAGKEAHNTKPAERALSKGCCPVPAASKTVSSNSSYCGGKASPSAPESAGADCNKGCCSDPSPPKVEDPENPSCCEGKASPCCDVSCIDRIALRECDVSSGTSPRSIRVAA